MNRITRWFSTLPPERQFDIQVKVCITTLAILVILLIGGWIIANDAVQRVIYVNSLNANLSRNISFCTGIGS